MARRSNDVVARSLREAEDLVTAAEMIMDAKTPSAPYSRRNAAQVGVLCRSAEVVAQRVIGFLIARPNTRGAPGRMRRAKKIVTRARKLGWRNAEALAARRAGGKRPVRKKKAKANASRDGKVSRSGRGPRKLPGLRLA